MSEPQNPAAGGVASVLKSLRTRAGLREDRLSETEVSLDALIGLDSVQELIAMGEPWQRAIVRAVRVAAGTLDPTFSIVVDASLGLELATGQIDDPELYARDLGLRRTALLRNWNRLHQLRSVQPGKRPSARALRLEVEAEALGALADVLSGPGGAVTPTGPAAARAATADESGEQPGDRLQQPSPGSAELLAFGAELRKTLVTRELTAQDVASRMAVQVSEMTKWLNGVALPSEADATRLDEALIARGAIMQLAEELRTQPAAAWGVPPTGETALPRSVNEPSGTLGEVFRKTAAALRGSLTRADDGTPLGWPQDLRQLSRRPETAVSTAYGLRTMLLLEGDLAPDLVPVVENLRRMSVKAGILAGEPAVPEQADRPPLPPPEIIALVTDTLHRVEGAASFDTQVAAMGKGLADFEKSRPFILTIMLEAALRLRGADELTKLLAESLLKARRPYGAALLWPEKAEPLLIDPEPSLAHTARAVRALARLLQESPDEQLRNDEQLRDAVDQGVSWLLEQREFPTASDVVDRLVRGRIVMGYTRHFTPAWVVKALVSAGIPATHPTVSNAVGQVWDSYAGDTAALWKWPNGDLPVWLTCDAVEALQLASQAVPARPGS
jgi:transcriptional regulator with XRE-family HTH domain